MTTIETSGDLWVVCPNCDYNFPLAKGLTQQAKELLLAVEQEQLETKRREMEVVLAQELERLEAEREGARLSLAQERERLEAEQEQVREELRQQVREEVGVEFDDLRAAAAEEKRKLSEAREIERELRTANRELRQKVEEQDTARDRERDELDAQLREEYQQANAVKLKEKEDHIERLTSQITELKRKADSQSRLAEGVPNQEVFADWLRHLFPHDHIEVIPRGQAGADVIQVVYSPSGQRWGAIRWECKRAANWQGEWVDKLAKDRMDAGADVGILVSEALPAGMKGCGQVGTVWVCNYATAPAMAMALREGLVQVAGYRTANALRQDAAGKVFDYIATGGFRPWVLELCRGIGHMHDDLYKEKQATTRHWAQRGKQLERCLKSISSLVGELGGVGAEIPPEVRAEMALPYDAPVAALEEPEPSLPKGSTSIICRDCGQRFILEPHAGRPPVVCRECRGDDNRSSAKS